jgi:hypothetical protein
MNYYLKTNTEQEMWEALETASLAKKEYDMEDALNNPPEDYDYETNGEFVKTGAYDWVALCQLDMIGTIYQKSGTMLTDEEGNEYPEMIAIDGFHANLKTDKVVEGLPTIDAPTTPYRKWLGE